MNRKGFFFSIDALLALATSVILLSMLFYWSAHLDVGKLREGELLSYSQSVASVMEEQDAFAYDNLRSFLDSYTRNETCFNVTVYSSQGLLQYSVVKNGCTNTSYPSTLSRSFIGEDGSFYLARLEGWYDA